VTLYSFISCTLNPCISYVWRVPFMCVCDNLPLSDIGFIHILNPKPIHIVCVTWPIHVCVWLTACLLVTLNSFIS